MKRIAIFGDSFADNNTNSQFNNDSAWPDILEQKGIKVHNYAQAGSSLVDAWKKYYSFSRSPVWKVCDAVIFVITEPGREAMTIDKDTYWLTSTSKTQLQLLKQNTEPGSQVYKLLDSIYNYWTHIKDHEQDKLFHDLLVAKIKSEPKMFYLNSFGSSSTFETREKMSLCDISMTEVQYWRPDLQSYADELNFMTSHRDTRKCHFSAENNLMIADKIYEALLKKEKTVVFHSSDIQQPSKPLEYYFKKTELNI
jgi:hypothetical protein